MRVRDKYAATHLESTLFDLLGELAAEAGQSNSTFLRSLILKELISKDRIPQEVLQIYAGNHVAHVIS